MKIHFDLSCLFRITNQLRGMNNPVGDLDLSIEGFFLFLINLVSLDEYIVWITDCEILLNCPIWVNVQSTIFDQGIITHFWGP